MEKAEKGNREKTYSVYSVRLAGMHFLAHHGCLENERTYGNNFKVDFCGEYTSCAGSTDVLDDAIDYGKVYGCVASVMNGERCNLLETLATRIADAIAEEFHGFTRFDVTVAKKNPPVAGPCEWSSIKVERHSNG